MSNPLSPQRLQPSVTGQRKISIAIRLVIAVILIAFSIFPIIWMISASLNPTGTLATQTLIPKNAGFDNYRKLLTLDRISFLEMARKLDQDRLDHIRTIACHHHNSSLCFLALSLPWSRNDA